MKKLGIIGIVIVLALLPRAYNKSEAKDETSTEIYDPLSAVPDYIKHMLPDGVTNIKLVDSYGGYDTDVWFTFEMYGGKFLFGVHGIGSSERLGTCITNMQYIQH